MPVFTLHEVATTLSW